MVHPAEEKSRIGCALLRHLASRRIGLRSVDVDLQSGGLPGRVLDLWQPGRARQLV